MSIISEHAPYFIAREGNSLLVCKMEGVLQMYSTRLSSIRIRGNGGLGKAMTMAYHEIHRQRAIAAGPELLGKTIRLL